MLLFFSFLPPKLYKIIVFHNIYKLLLFNILSLKFYFLYYFEKIIRKYFKGIKKKLLKNILTKFDNRGRTLSIGN